MTNISRRDFLKIATDSLLAVSGILGIGGLIRFLSYRADPAPQSEFDIGPSAMYPKNSRTILSDIPAVVIHADEGIRAISLTCTHLGCTIEERSFGFECPCHGSQYDLDGKVLKGPAGTKLKKLRLNEMEDGNLHVFTT
jgi:cytochrome b6-f complex iron-sulfur subunit